ncbi:hypothetical protein Ddye_003925 [Dipteronia dyeriana]|uniref:Uncharacterized protein n=1 Tax=Dipteronia dyeriana TaxID=168575 RepID=A0AAE0CVU6_9ROSI|nr:hypothetical protein Ddye_003925 [Dipteronia dyeriana]
MLVVQVEDTCLSKVHRRRYSRNASRSKPIANWKKLPMLWERVSNRSKGKSKSLMRTSPRASVNLWQKNNPRRSSRVASKGDLVEPATPTVKTVKRRQIGCGC